MISQKRPKKYKSYREKNSRDKGKTNIVLFYNINILPTRKCDSKACQNMSLGVDFINAWNCTGDMKIFFEKEKNCPR